MPEAKKNPFFYILYWQSLGLHIGITYFEEIIVFLSTYFPENNLWGEKQLFVSHPHRKKPQLAEKNNKCKTI